MSIYVDTCFESLNKFNEELCGDKVEIIRSDNSSIIVLADGLGSGVKANILATLTSKIIATMLSNGLSLDEAVETIASTLPVCRERDIAYSTFSILQIMDSGEGYLVEFDNPSVFFMKKGKRSELEKQTRMINGKLVTESRFNVSYEDLFILVSDGVIHAGVGATLNLGWQWNNVREYIERIYKSDLSPKNIVKLLLSVCENLYARKPGDDTTVAAIKIRKPVVVNVMIGPPVNKNEDRNVVNRFFDGEGKKVVCGGTTSQIVSRVLNKKITTNIKYYNPQVPPTAEIEGIDLVTEGVLTFGKALEYAKRYLSTGSNIKDLIELGKRDGASRLAKLLLEESTKVNFFIGRAINPAHQNPELPLDLGLKIKLVKEMAECLKSLGKRVEIEYY
ncbi:MAG: SpoIIE family protein phosphatase [Clostridiaceae bacterium]|nr:SpoIIE family protein phosphatase [Clostridiaceae bacterium]